MSISKIILLYVLFYIGSEIIDIENRKYMLRNQMERGYKSLGGKPLGFKNKIIKFIPFVNMLYFTIEGFLTNNPERSRKKAEEYFEFKKMNEIEKEIYRDNPSMGTIALISAGNYEDEDDEELSSLLSSLGEILKDSLMENGFTEEQVYELTDMDFEDKEALREKGYTEEQIEFLSKNVLELFKAPQEDTQDKEEEHIIAFKPDSNQKPIEIVFKPSSEEETEESNKEEKSGPTLKRKL